jgi:hypothetical protein
LWDGNKIGSIRLQFARIVNRNDSAGKSETGGGQGSCFYLQLQETFDRWGI